MRNTINQIGLILIAFLFFACNQNEIIKVQSPDGKVQINFGINDSSAIYYSIDNEDSIIIQNSKMGFQFDGGAECGKNLEIISFSKIGVNQLWKPVYGERSEIKDQYNQVKIRLKKKVLQGGSLKLRSGFTTRELHSIIHFLRNQKTKHFKFKKNLPNSD